MTNAERTLVQQHAWTCSFEDNMERAQGLAEAGAINTALVIADIAFHQLRIKAIHREQANHVQQENQCK